MKYLILSLVAISFSSAFAVSDAGTRGGGNALICFTDPTIPAAIRKDKGEIKDEYISKIKSIEMLDLYEVKLARGMDETTTVEIKDVQKDEGLTQYSTRLLQRIRPFVPQFYNTAVEMMAQMTPNLAVAHPYGIENVNDFNLSGRIDSRNCVVGTVLSHTPNGAITDIHYDQRLWNHPSFGSLNKHVAYLHEVVYRTYRETKDMDASSDQARRIVGLLLKKSVTQTELIQQLYSALELVKFSPEQGLNMSQCATGRFQDDCYMNFGIDVVDFLRNTTLTPSYEVGYPRTDSLWLFMENAKKIDPAFKKYKLLSQTHSEIAAFNKLTMAEKTRVQCLNSQVCMREPFVQASIKTRIAIFEYHRKMLKQFVATLTNQKIYGAQQISKFQKKAEALLDSTTMADHRKAALEFADNEEKVLGGIQFDFSDFNKIEGQF